MLAHVASREGLIAAENAAGSSRRMSYRAIPIAIFTVPEIACVGLTESGARQEGYDVRSDLVHFPMRRNVVPLDTGSLKVQLSA